MVRYRKVKKYGDSWVIKLNPADVDDLNLKIGDLVDIEDAVCNKLVPKLLTKFIKKKR